MNVEISVEYMIELQEKAKRLKVVDEALELACEELAHISCNSSAFPCNPENDCRTCWYEYLMKKVRE